MKLALALLSLAAASVASAQTPPVTMGPPYIARGQVVTIPTANTLTSPAMTAFPVDAFTVQDLGTIDGQGNQTVISTTPWTQTSFNMLDSGHINKPITASYGGQTYTVPEGAIVALFGGAVQAELDSRAAAKAKPVTKAASPVQSSKAWAWAFRAVAPDGVNEIYFSPDGRAAAETLVEVYREDALFHR